MAAWDRRYNISGTLHCGTSIEADDVVSPSRVEDWCGILRAVLQTDNIGILGHMTGAVSVYAASPVAFVVSSGWEIHNFWAFVPGERANWLRFGELLESALTEAAVPYSLIVHQAVQVLS
jgi:hypothetical protein